MPGGRERAAVVLRGRHRHAGGHAVVDQAADAVAQRRGQRVVFGIVGAAGVAVDGAGEVAFQRLRDLLQLRLRLGQHQQADLAEGLVLQRARCLDEAAAGDLQQGRLERVTGGVGDLAAGQQLGAGVAQCAHRLGHQLRAARGQQHAGGRGRGQPLHFLHEGVGVRARRQHRDAGTGAELARAHRAGGGQLGGDRRTALAQGTAQHEHRVDAGHLQVGRRAGRVGGGLDRHAGRTAAGERHRGRARIAHHAQPQLVAGVEEHLHRARRQAAGLQRLQRGFRQQLRGMRMGRMRLGDHRVAGGKSGGEITAGDAIEGEREIVRPQHQHRATQRAEYGAQVGGGVDRGPGPAAVTRGLGGLAQLAGGARQLAVAQAPFERQAGLAMRGFDQGVGTRLDGGGVGVEEGADALARQLRHLGGGTLAGVQHRVQIGPTGDRVIVRVQLLPLRGIERVEAAFRRLRLDPAAVDKNGLHGSGVAHDTGFSRTRPPMSMLTTSPACRVKVSSGTMPVPVNRKAPWGNASSRNR